ncbi:LysR family transcriptional regulator [Bacillus sp. FJAT-50079]|uniref:LysR family transcriptional regulator n=1 Tax=Bacillus sp. FJAT-50079 TaxID=2833577 RepID=UPI001BC9993E|nr:LysR family transcriptional regulator [Bacillus sp. FJAT-50079]MBS4206603.1 LysR family transcriptional regulator [Bacillus sp. FJAT-50079]
MNLHHLYIFCAVSEMKSFTKASKKINISQPAISQHINNLEFTLGKKLIERRGRLFKLTNHGEVLLEYGRRIFNMVEEAENALVRSGKHKEKLFIGTSTIPGTYFLPGFISNFMETNPYVRFNVTLEESNADLIEKLINNQIDLAINYESVILRDEIQISRITQDELVLVLPGKHPWANGQIISFEEILTLPFIFHSKELFIRSIMENILSGNTVNVVLELSNLEAIKAAIIHGLGVSMLPYSTIQLELEHGLLAIANCSTFRVPRNLTLLRKRSSFELGTAQEVIDFLLNNNSISKY